MIYMRLFRILIVGLFTVQTACASEDLDFALYIACQNIANDPTCVEYFSSVCHCKPVATLRLQDIENKLKAGANPNKIRHIQGLFKLAPLHWAVRNNNPRLVEILFKYRVDPNLAAELTDNNMVTIIKPLGLAMHNYVQFHLNSKDGYLYLGEKSTPVEYPKAYIANQKVAQLLLKHDVVPDGREQESYAKSVKEGTLSFRHPNPRCVGAL